MSRFVSSRTARCSMRPILHPRILSWVIFLGGGGLFLIFGENVAKPWSIFRDFRVFFSRFFGPFVSVGCFLFVGCLGVFLVWVGRGGRTGRRQIECLPCDSRENNGRYFPGFESGVHLIFVFCFFFFLFCCLGWDSLCLGRCSHGEFSTFFCRGTGPGFDDVNVLQAGTKKYRSPQKYRSPRKFAHTHA